MAARERRGVPAVEPLPRGLDADEPGPGLADEARQQAHGVGAAADAGDGDVRQPSLDGAHLFRALVADDPLQVTHEAAGTDAARPRNRARSGSSRHA